MVLSSISVSLLFNFDITFTQLIRSLWFDKHSNTGSDDDSRYITIIIQGTPDTLCVGVVIWVKFL